MSTPTLSALPRDILTLLPCYIHNIEDFTSLSSTCRLLYNCLSSATPNTILRLAVAQDKIFFRPTPLFLLMATARQLGNWARLSDSNEEMFASACKGGNSGLLELAIQHCGLTMQRIRELHLARFEIMNPVIDIIDKCVGQQWYSTPDFWDGGVSDAYTIRSEVEGTFFHLAIYGELFSPDLDAILRKEHKTRRLKVDTRLEFVKYCIPDEACGLNQGMDPRRDIEFVGPYARDKGTRSYVDYPKNNNIALTWTMRSSRFRPYWKAMRNMTGPDFQQNFDDGWWYVPDERLGDEAQDWRQRLWENVMLCQGLEGLGMMRDGLREAWVMRVKEWKDLIEDLEREPENVLVGRQATKEYPLLLGDLRVCASGYVSGT